MPGEVERVREIFGESSATHARAAESLGPAVAEAAAVVVAALRAGSKILLCGNGGSAADAQHIAAELAGRLRRERKGLPAVALTVNPSVLTAVANDYGYEQVFSRQVEALGEKGDVLIGISTSGRSANVVRALEAARRLGMATIGLMGEERGVMAGHCDVVVAAPSSDTQRIQEIHIVAGHAICEIVESDLFGS
jgi:D-sedoheptulose 7-phosphate isomerase